MHPQRFTYIPDETTSQQISVLYRCIRQLSNVQLGVCIRFCYKYTKIPIVVIRVIFIG